MGELDEWSHAEMARRLGVKRSGISATSFGQVLRRDPCAYCSAPYRSGSWREVDHIHARARGGANRWANYTAACGFCNVCKCDSSLLEWLLELGEFERTTGFVLGFMEVPW